MAFDKTYQDFINDSTVKKVIIFGAGRYLAPALNILSDDGVSVSYIVDNNFWKNGTSYNGIMIRTIKSLFDENPNEVVVLICVDDIFSVETQLLAHGIVHYYALPLFPELLYKNNIGLFSSIPLTDRYQFDFGRPNIYGQALIVMIANRCNLRCKFCSHAKNQNGEIMSVGKYKNILNQIPNLLICGNSISTIRLDGNREALLHPDLGEIMLQTQLAGLRMFMVTNGTLLNDKNSELIVKHCDCIVISVTGVSGQVYEKFQGHGFSDCDARLEKLVKGVQALTKLRDEKHSKLRVHISYIGNADSCPEFREAVSLWRNVGADRIRIINDTMELDEDLTKCGILQYRPNTSCFSSTVVFANGDVHPCCLRGGESIVLGNCFDEPLETIFESNRYYEFACNLASLNPNKLRDECKLCHAFAEHN